MRYVSTGPAVAGAGHVVVGREGKPERSLRGGRADGVEGGEAARDLGERKRRERGSRKEERRERR
eukprot:333984-Rhodomonas_salina.1